MNFEETLIDKITELEIDDVTFVHLYDDVFQYADKEIKKIVCRGNIADDDFRAFLKKLDSCKQLRNILMTPNDFIASFRREGAGSRLNLHQMMTLLDDMEGDFLTKEDELIFEINDSPVTPYLVGDKKIAFKAQDFSGMDLNDKKLVLELHVHGWTNNEKFSFRCHIEKTQEAEYKIEDLVEFDVYPQEKLSVIQDYIKSINSSVSRIARNAWEFKG